MTKQCKYCLPDGVWVHVDNETTLIYHAKSRRIYQANLLVGFVLDSVRLEPLSLDEIVKRLKEETDGADGITCLRDSIHKLVKKLEAKGFLEVR